MKCQTILRAINQNEQMYAISNDERRVITADYAETESTVNNQIVDAKGHSFFGYSRFLTINKGQVKHNT